MTEPAVVVEGLTKVFPIPFRRTKVVAIRGLNLEVAPGPGLRVTRPKRIGQKHDP